MRILPLRLFFSLPKLKPFHWLRCFWLYRVIRVRIFMVHRRLKIGTTWVHMHCSGRQLKLQRVGVVLVTICLVWRLTPIPRTQCMGFIDLNQDLVVRCFTLLDVGTIRLTLINITCCVHSKCKARDIIYKVLD